MSGNTQPAASDAMAPAADGMDDLFGVSIPQLQIPPQEVAQPQMQAPEAPIQGEPVVTTPPVQEPVTPPTAPVQTPVQGEVDVAPFK